MRPLYGSLAAGLIKTVKLKYKIFLFTIPILLLLKRGFGGRRLHLSLREKKYICLCNYSAVWCNALVETWYWHLSCQLYQKSTRKYQKILRFTKKLQMNQKVVLNVQSFVITPLCGAALALKLSSRICAAQSLFVFVGIPT